MRELVYTLSVKYIPKYICFVTTIIVFNLSGKLSHAKRYRIKNTIKVLIADDHALIRQFLRSVLEQEEDITVIGEATDGEETLSLVRSLDVNIVIIDIAMPKLNGIEATRIIKKEFPDIHILVLTIYDDSEHILSILEAGASGYLTKNIIGETIPRTIRALYNGESVLTEDVMKKLLGYAVRYPSKAIDLGWRYTIDTRNGNFTTVI
jgi:DNA-binding NarL/FixJ family response regulator